MIMGNFLGLSETAVNEALSVDEELKLVGWKRVIPVYGAQPEQYALRHEVTELLELQETQPLSTVQRSALLAAQGRYLTLLTYDTVVPTIITSGTAYGVRNGFDRLFKSPVDSTDSDVLADAEKNNQKFEHADKDPNSYRQIVFDKNGNVLAEKKDGGWVRLLVN